MQNLHTCIHTTHPHLGSFGVVKLCSLWGEARRGWERRAENETYDYTRLHSI